jgi:hypothetical protein
LVDELVEVLDSAGLPLKPRLRLTPSVVRVLVREDLVRAPRGNQEWRSVRVKFGVSVASIYSTMRHSQRRDPVPRASDDTTTRRSATSEFSHRWGAGEAHPYSPQSGHGSGWDEPPAAS